ncbi:MAG: hypothetical protein O6704_03280 [Nitrospinae bacterium]|nr:hypothetical protein [Nitrospinota bacterium]
MSGLNDVLIAVLNVYQKGNIFLFGPLAIGPGQTLPDGTASVGFVLAMQVLPAVIFFSAVVAGLYYLKVMPALIRGFAWLFYRVMRISGAEALCGLSQYFCRHRIQPDHPALPGGDDAVRVVDPVDLHDGDGR